MGEGVARVKRDKLCMQNSLPKMLRKLKRPRSMHTEYATRIKEWHQHNLKLFLCNIEILFSHSTLLRAIFSIKLAPSEYRILLNHLHDLLGQPLVLSAPPSMIHQSPILVPHIEPSQVVHLTLFQLKPPLSFHWCIQFLLCNSLVLLVHLIDLNFQHSHFLRHFLS